MAEINQNYKKSISNFINNNKNKTIFNQIKNPNSVLYTKIEIPLFYSNKIIIEDMKFEGSNYYITSNGFLSSKLGIESQLHSKNFNIMNCIFRIFPKTYSFNKYKVLDVINKLSTENDNKMNLKYESEIFNNLDIIQSKMGEPIRYGDIIMLMHESSNKFIKFNFINKSITLTDNDSELTLFQVEPSNEIIINDNQILKSGQGIRLKVASFQYSSNNLYISLHFPFQEEENINENNKKNEQEVFNKSSELNNVISNSLTYHESQNERFDNKSNSESEGLIFDRINFDDIYDKVNKKYIKNPELIIEEESSMKWRFNTYSTFTTYDDLLFFGDFVSILHSFSNTYLTCFNDTIFKKDDINIKEKSNSSSELIYNINNNILINDFLNKLNNQDDIDEESDFSDLLIENCSEEKINFCLQKFIDISETNEDIGSTWVLENIFTNLKHTSFIRYYEDNKLDSYHMTFRIKHFQSSKYLTLKKISPELLKTEKNILNKISIKFDTRDNLYTFQLMEMNLLNEITDEIISSSEYQYSLFGFVQSTQIKNKSKRIEKNSHLNLFHIATKSYIKILYIEKDFKIEEIKENSNIINCALTLTNHQEEQDIIKIIPIHLTTKWKFEFLNSIKNLLKSIIVHINNMIFENSKQINFNILVMKAFPFIMKNLTDFVTNKFITKFNNDFDYESICIERQNLIFKFDFIRIILGEFIYDFWISNNMTNLIILMEIYVKLKNNENHINFLSLKEKIIFKISQFTDQMFNFLTVFCRNNIKIKNELYKYLHVFMYFLNLKVSAVNCLIEIFQDNNQILNSLIKDCKSNNNFKLALEIIYKRFIFNKSDFIKKSNYESKTIIDLIIEYIKISLYKDYEYNDFKLIQSIQSNMNTISLIKREEYFYLLKTLVFSNVSLTFIENQKYIFEKIVNLKDMELLPSLIRIENTSLFPSCLVELLIYVVKDNTDNNMISLMRKLFPIEIIIENIKIFNKIKNENNFSTLLLLTYYIKLFDFKTLIENSDFLKIIQLCFQNFEYGIEIDQKTNKIISKINFSINSEVKYFISYLKFFYNYFKKNLDCSTNNYFNGELLTKLLIFMNQQFYNNSNEFLNFLPDELNKRHNILKDKIIKSQNSNYFLVLKNWFNVLLVFKNILSKRIFSENIQINNTINKVVNIDSKNKNLPYETNNIKIKNHETKNEKKNFLEHRNINIDKEKLKHEILNKKNNSVLIKNLFKDEDFHFMNNKNNSQEIKFEDNINSEDSKIISENSSLIIDINNEDISLTNSNDKNNNAINISKNSNFFEQTIEINKSFINNEIISLFELFIKKNYSLMMNKFIDFYIDSSENNFNFERNNKNKENAFNLFLNMCIPPFDCDEINSYINTFLSFEIKHKKNLKKWEIDFYNFYNMKNQEIKPNLCLIYNLMISYNISDALELQEKILFLIYSLFSQRKIFLEKILELNDLYFNLILNNKVEIEELKLEKLIIKFFNDYENIKLIIENKEIDINLIEKFNKLIFSTIFNFIFYLLEFLGKIYENINNNDNKISLDYLYFLKNEINLILKEENLDLAFELGNKYATNFFYFIRKNKNKQELKFIKNFSNSNIFEKYIQTIFRDFIEKFKIINSYDLSTKKYTIFCYLILIHEIFSSTNNNFIGIFFESHKNIIFNNSMLSLLIILILSDNQVYCKNLNYFYILDMLKEHNNISTINNQNKSIKNDLNINRLYIDILINIIDYVSFNNKIINESNLDDLIIEVFIFLLVNMNKAFIEGLLFEMIIKLISKIISIDNLCRILTTKLNNFPNYYNILPKPENLIQKFFDCFKIKSIGNYSSAFYLLNYFLKYFFEINTNYLKRLDIPKYNSINKKYKSGKSKIISLRILMYCLSNYISENYSKDEYLSKISMFFNWEFQSNLKLVFDSDIYPLLFLLIHKNISFIKSTEDLYIDKSLIDINMSKIYSNLLSRNENIMTSINHENKDFFLIYHYLYKNIIHLFQDINFDNTTKEIYNIYQISKNNKILIDEKLVNFHNFSSSKLTKIQTIIVSNSKKCEELVTNEAKIFLFYIINMFKKENENSLNFIFIYFLNKTIDFIFKSSLLNNTENKNLIEICNFFSYIYILLLDFYNNENNMNYIQFSNLKYQNIKEFQFLFERAEILDKFLKLICNFQIINKKVIPFVISTLNCLLKGGNKQIQDLIYASFCKKSEMELCFKYMYSVISDCIEDLKKNKTFILNENENNQIYKEFSHQSFNLLNKNILFDEENLIIKFLQLLCENHNNRLQNFLRQQNFKKNYDLLSLSNKFLHILFKKFNNNLFNSIIKCFDLLIEFVQGPCLENQMEIINSKLLVTINDIFGLYLKIDNIGNHIINNTNINFQESSNFLINMNPLQISILTYKSSILILSLIEGRTHSDNLYQQIRFSLKIDLIRKVYFKIYFQYQETLINTYEFNSNLLRMKDLNKSDEIEKKITISHSSINTKDYLIIESGFNLFFICQYFNDFSYLKGEISENYYNLNKQSKNNGYENILQKIKNSNNIIFCIIMFLIGILTDIVYFFALLISNLIFYLSLKKINIFFILKKKLKKKLTIRDSIEFYLKYVRSIEIFRFEEVYKIYFISLPLAKDYQDEEKNNFLELMDRTNSKTKLMDILKISSLLKYELESNYSIRRIFSNIPVIGRIFNNIKLLKDISLSLTIIQNLINIITLRAYDTDNKFSYSKIISLFQVVMASIILIEFFIRKTPSIMNYINEEFNNLDYNCVNKKFYYIKNFIVKGFINIEVIYYCLYLLCSIIGYIYSSIFFAFLLIEVIIRIKTLKNILMSIKMPAKELILTFILWLVVIYFFTIFAYAFFIDEFREPNDCSSVLRCFLTFVYQTNKNDNGIGDYLIPVKFDKNRNPFNGRFWYDQLYNIIVKILIIQMIAGIIIDNFAKLRDEDMERKNDMKNICTICGRKRDEVEKIYENYSLTYNDHIKYDHNIFNYIYYIIFLHYKDKTEFTGMESYIYNMVYNQKDITWFPHDKIYLENNKRHDIIS